MLRLPIAAISLLACVLSTAQPAWAAFNVSLRPLQLDPALIAERMPGLDLRAAYELRASDAPFGGISGALAKDDRIWLLSDRSRLFEARIVEDTDGVILDLIDWHVTELQEQGLPVDAEALAWVADGVIAVAIEGEHRIRCLDDQPLSGVLVPCNLAAFYVDSDANFGIEALTTLNDGTLVALIESDGPYPSTVPAFRLSAGSATKFSYHVLAGFKPTGIDRLDNRLYVLERRLSFLGGWEARIVQLEADQILQGANTVTGSLLGRLGVGMEVDNFEAIAARRTNIGGDELLVFSDDNFLPVQRSLFYQFGVKEPR